MVVRRIFIYFHGVYKKKILNHPSPVAIWLSREKSIWIYWVRGRKIYRLPSNRFSRTFNGCFNSSTFFQPIAWWPRTRPRFSMTSSWTWHLKFCKTQKKKNDEHLFNFLLNFHTNTESKYCYQCNSSTYVLTSVSNSRNNWKKKSTQLTSMHLWNNLSTCVVMTRDSISTHKKNFFNISFRKKSRDRIGSNCFFPEATADKEWILRISILWGKILR